MNIVIVGYGSIGIRHLKNLVSLRDTDQFPMPVENIKIVETDSYKREKAEQNFGFTVWDSLGRDLNQKQDVVFICTPSNIHIPLAQQAAEAGCHLFIEKPLSTTLDGVKDLMTILKRTGKSCLVACNMWFHPGIKKLRDILTSGELGQPPGCFILTGGIMWLSGILT